MRHDSLKSIQLSCPPVLLSLTTIFYQEIPQLRKSFTLSQYDFHFIHVIAVFILITDIKNAVKRCYFNFRWANEGLINGRLEEIPVPTKPELSPPEFSPLMPPRLELRLPVPKLPSRLPSPKPDRLPKLPRRFVRPVPPVAAGAVCSVPAPVCPASMTALGSAPSTVAEVLAPGQGDSSAAAPFDPAALWSTVAGATGGNWCCCSRRPACFPRCLNRSPGVARLEFWWNLLCPLEFPQLQVITWTDRSLKLQLITSKKGLQV